MEQFTRIDCINDSRSTFNNVTFSGYKKNQVVQQLEKSIINSQIEESCHWSVELIVSGHYQVLFDSIINVYCKAVNCNNPLFPMLLLSRYKKFISIQSHPDIQAKPINLRNNDQFRYLFAELVLYICLSKKTHVYSLPKIKTDELSIGNIKYRFKNNHFYLENIRKEHDHHELIEIGNELVCAVASKNIQDALFWLQWILTWEKTNKKKGVSLCHPRKITNIDTKFESDVIWFIWTIIIGICSHEIQKKQIMSLFHIYCHDFNSSRKYQRISIVVSCLIFLIEKFDSSIPITKNDSKVRRGIENIGYFYKEINETSNPNAHLIPPITNFGLNETNQSTSKKPKKKNKKELDNLETEDSFQKLELVNQIFNSTFID